MLSVPGSGTDELPWVTLSLRTETVAKPFVPAATVRSFAIEISLTPEKLTLSVSCCPAASSNTVKVTSCPPVQVGNIAPRQAVSATITSPVPMNEAPPIESERPVIGVFELIVVWKSESCSSTPLPVEASHPALHCRPGPGKERGVVAMDPAGIENPGGLDVPL